MKHPRPRNTRRQTAVDHQGMPGHEARLAAGQSERSVSNFGRKPGSAQRQRFCEPGFHNVWGALDEFCRDFPSYWGKDRGGNSAGTNGVNSNPALREFQRHRFRFRFELADRSQASRTLAGVILQGAPPLRPRARAEARPALVRSEISSRWNSERAAKMPKISLPGPLRSCQWRHRGWSAP
jgi:hypothetical protein